MSGQHGRAGDTGTLEAVRRLEQALDARTGANELAAGLLATARAEAEGILAAARAAGIAEGHRRVAVLLAQATEEAEAIRAGGRADAQELQQRALADCDDLVAELTAIVTAVEA